MHFKTGLLAASGESRYLASPLSARPRHRHGSARIVPEERPWKNSQTCAHHIIVTARGLDRAQYCILDIETAGPITQPPDTYELLLVGLKHERQHTIFRCNRRELSLFASFIDDFKGTVVTFNGSRFDLPIVGHALRLATGRPLRVSKHYDILAKVEQHAGRRISLDDLARENLRIGKSEWDHRRNKEIWQSSPELLIAHNQEDLNLTARLFEIVLQGQRLKVDGMNVLLPFGIQALRGGIGLNH